MITLNNMKKKVIVKFKELYLRGKMLLTTEIMIGSLFGENF